MRLLTVFCLCGAGTATASADTSARAVSIQSADLPPGVRTPGLYVDRGVLMKAGRPYRGVGINYFNAFIRCLANPDDRSYKAGLAVLCEKNIPFVRFTPNGYWAREWSLFIKDRPRYFALLDEFIHEAEQQRIGLIPSFFWFFGALPDAVGEPIDQWGNPASKTHALMREYVNAVVERYKDSLAIWAWEFGNEHRLHIDLPGERQGLPHVAPSLGTPTTRTARDKLERSAVECAQREFALAVRRIDPHRLLVTGDAMVRSCAYHLMTARKWQRDTPAQTTAMLLRDNADPYDSISIHLYPVRDYEYFDPPAPLRFVLGVCQDAALAIGKPLFMGEFGASEDLGEAKVREHVTEYLDAIVELRIPLSALWVYDLSLQDGTYNITPSNNRAWMLDAVGETNRRLQQDRASTQPGTRPGPN